METGDHRAEAIRNALAVEGGHLCIGHNGNILHYADGSKWHSYDDDTMKAACIAAGLIVIDSRLVSFDSLCTVVLRGPMPAVGRPPSPEPWHALSYVPLDHLEGLYRAIDAEIIHAPINPSV